MDVASDHEDGFSADAVADSVCSGNLAALKAALPSGKRERNAARQAGVASLFSVAVEDPRAAGQSQPQGFKAELDASTPSLLSEPSADQIVQGNVFCPLSGRSLASQAAPEEPELDAIAQQIQSILAWSTTSSSSSSTALENAVYPAVFPRTKQQSTTADDEMQVDEDANDGALPAAVVPCSPLWSHTHRRRLSSRFVADHALNDRVYRHRKHGQPSAVAVPPRDLAMHLLVVQQPSAFPQAGGWDLVMQPEYARVLLTTLSFAILTRSCSWE